MDLSNLSELFQKTNALQAGGLFAGAKQAAKQAVPSDMLQQISDKMITQEQGAAETEVAKKTLEIKLDTYTKTDSSRPLEEMPEEVLAIYMHITKLFANSASRQEQDLRDFKERLQGMDQTIQAYQDVLDGKSALPKGLNAEDVIKSITKAKEAREQLVKDGVEHLNRWSGDFITSDYYDTHIKKVLGENQFAGRDSSDWELDSSSSDIYAEIDRVLENTHSVTAELDRGVERIYNVLKERGFEDKYKHYVESWRSENGSYFNNIQAKSIQQIIMDNLKSGPLNEV